MPSKRPDIALQNIHHHIELAEQFVKGLGRDAIMEDARTVYAVTRCLEIISEASRRLPEKL